MTPAILFIALGLLAILFGPPLLGLVLLVGRLAAGAAILAFRLLRIILVGAGYVAALLMWGVWLCVDRRGALAAYRDCPKPIARSETVSTPALRTTSSDVRAA